MGRDRGKERRDGETEREWIKEDKEGKEKG